MARISQSIAMGVGVGGAMVDVSAYADLDAGVEYVYGRQSEFEDAAPSTFSFVLDNPTGDFTPDNASSTLATTVTERMKVCWQSGSRLVEGAIQGIEPVFPESVAAWSQVRITCDDQLGAAGRNDLDELGESLYQAATPLRQWPMQEVPDAAVLQERGGYLPFTVNYPADVTTGVTNSHLPTERAVQLTYSVARSDAQLYLFNQNGLAPQSSYDTTSMGSWGFWFERTTADPSFSLFYSARGGPAFSVKNYGTGAISLTAAGSGGTPPTTQDLIIGQPYWIEVTSSTVFAAGVWTVSFTLIVNGVVIGTDVYGSTLATLNNSSRQIAAIGIQVTSVGTVYISDLSHTLAPLNKTPTTTEASRLTQLENAAAGDITLDTLPTDLSTALLGPANTSGQSVLTALNDVIRTEQGHISTVTTGTLLASTQKVRVKSRTRPSTVTSTFSAVDEADGAPEFVRSILDMVSTVTVQGPTQDVLVTDSTLVARVGSANSSETVLNSGTSDLRGWGQDRLLRGANVKLKIVSITIDAMTTPTDRSSDLLSMVLGNRYQITDLPSAQLGFTTWDGWFLGADETHTTSEHSFTLYFQPVLPATAIFDTDRYMADGVLSLSANINASTTSISIATSATTTKFTTAGGDLPVTIIIGTEQMSVTACTSATPQVATVVRGVNGTTAASRSAGDLLELATSSLFAF